MKFEHRRQKVAPFPKFIIRVWRFTFFSLLLIIISVSIGTIGYRYMGDMTWLDSFYMACMILAGMGPVAEMATTKAILFSSFYALYSGVAFLSITAVFLAPIVHRLLHIMHVET